MQRHSMSVLRISCKSDISRPHLNAPSIQLMVLIDVYNNEPCNDARKTDEPVALGAPAVASRILHQGYPLRNECHDLGSPFV